VGISYHMPIVSKVAKNGPRPPSLMKFNHIWLNEEDYKRLVMNLWSPLVEDVGLS
jgi:hypothetical protein